MAADLGIKTSTKVETWLVFVKIAIVLAVIVVGCVLRHQRQPHAVLPPFCGFLIGVVIYACYGYRHSLIGHGRAVQTDDG